MPIHVEQVTTDIATFDGELPLSENQLRKLVACVATRLAECKRDESERRDAAKLDRPGVLPEAGGGG